MSKIIVLTPCFKKVYTFDKDPYHVAEIETFEDDDILTITFLKDNTMCATFHVGKSIPFDCIYRLYDDNEKFFDSKNEHFNNFFSAVKSNITTCKDNVSAIKLLVSDVKSFLEKWKEFDNE